QRRKSARSNDSTLLGSAARAGAAALASRIIGSVALAAILAILSGPAFTVIAPAQRKQEGIIEVFSFLPIKRDRDLLIVAAPALCFICHTQSPHQTIFHCSTLMKTIRNENL